MNSSKKYPSGPISTAHSPEALWEEVRSFSSQLEKSRAAISRISGNIRKLQAALAPGGNFDHTNPNHSSQKAFGSLEGLYAQLRKAQYDWWRVNYALGVCYAKLQAINDWLHMAQNPEYHEAIKRAVVFSTNESFSAQAIHQSSSPSLLEDAQSRAQERTKPARADSGSFTRRESASTFPEPIPFSHASRQAQVVQPFEVGAEGRATRSSSTSTVIWTGMEST